MQRPVRRWEFIDLLVLSIFIVVAMVLSFRPLHDVDLGWHLAGGLWILNNQTVPFTDPLAAGSRFWLCYSWLPEVFFALIYAAAGFRGLQAAQVVSILCSVVFVYWFVRRMRQAPEPEGSGFSGRLAELMTFSVILLLVAPVWHLRPQLLSVVLFGLMLVWAREGRFSVRLILPLTVIWANVHVYWIAAPLIAGVYLVFMPLVQRNMHRAIKGAGYCLLLFLSGIATPYSWRIFPAVTEYMFFHQEANRLIKEFQPVVPRIGALFYLLTAVTLLLAVSIKPIRRRIAPESILLALVFLAAAFLRRKYLPLFGLAVTPLLVDAAFPMLISFFSRGKTQTRLGGPEAMSGRQKVGLIGLSAVFFGLAVSSIKIEDPLTDRYRELFAVAEEVQQSLPPDKHPTIIGNHFDDGGWLELAFYLSRPPGTADSPFKAAIDGRTLVMGQQRLKEFGQLYFSPGEEANCEIIRKWQPAAFILPKGDRFTGQFYGGSKLLPCLSLWSFSERGSQWVVGLPSGAG